MSDYLWDKTGEPDAETERLEELLGQLRFQPTPFDLPAGLPAKEPRPARAGNILSWPRLAIAASVALAVLAGAWLTLRQQTGATNDKPQVAVQSNQPDAGGKHSTAALTTANETDENEAAAGNDKGGGKASGSNAAAPSKGSEKRREEQAAFPHRPRVPGIDRGATRRVPRANRSELARAPKRRENVTPPDAPARHDERAAITDAEREAAEKVLYALRITSEKLNYARQQVRGPGPGEDNR